MFCPCLPARICPGLSSPKHYEGAHLHLFSRLSMGVDLSWSGFASLRSRELSGWRLPLATQLMLPASPFSSSYFVFQLQGSQRLRNSSAHTVISHSPKTSTCSSTSEGTQTRLGRWLLGSPGWGPSTVEARLPSQSLSLVVTKAPSILSWFSDHQSRSGLLSSFSFRSSGKYL